MNHLLLVSGRFSSSQRKRFWNYDSEVLTPILQSHMKLQFHLPLVIIQRGVSSSFSYECRA